MARTLKYVCPSIVFKQQFNDDLPIFNDLESGSWKSYCDKIFASNLVIVTSSPGMGKSRLLRELFSEAKDYNFEACFLDLKGIGNRELERALSEFSSKWVPQSNSKFYDQTCDFQLDDDKRKVFFLDALDECAGNAQEKILAAALDFNHVKPRDIVVLSCREVVSKRHQITIDNRNALHAQIQDFHEGSVRGMLGHNGINNDQFIQVWHKLNTGWSFRSLRSPRDVEAFLELVEIHGFEQAIGKSVAEVYDAIIVHRLRDEENKFGKNHTAITQRLLERFALSMQVYSQSQITGDELMTFFEEIDSAIGNTFLQQVKLEYLYERALLDHNTFSDTIQFQNKEIQEYLAAKAINRFANSLQGTFNLIFNVDLEEFKPQWINTIKLLCGINPKLILPIVDFISKRKSEFDYEILEAALSADWGNSHIFSEQEKHEILIKSLSHYFLQGRYFSYSMDRNFAKFVTSNSTQKLLFDNFQLYGEEIDCVIPSIFRIVRTFHELGIDSLDYSFWSNRAKDRILDNNEKDLIKERRARNLPMA